MNRTLKIAGIEIKNRLAVPPMVNFNWADDSGFVTEKHIAQYEAYAAGGFGLVIVEATCVTKRGRLHESQLGLWEDAQIAGFAKLTEAVHKHGAKVFVQIHHAGINGIDKEAEAPSDIAWRNGITGHEMSRARIARTVQDFADAAVRAQKAGFDGVELHGCHGYLFSQFMNSRLNRRTDEYGTDKTLIVKETFRAVRAAVSPEFVVGIRLGAFEPLLEDGLAHAQELAPYTDFMDVSYGGECDPEKPEGFPCSAAVYGASRVKALLPDMPVFGVDHICTRADVENALATGIDVADIGRSALVDPAFAKHVLSGEPEGHCLHCTGRCAFRAAKRETAVCAGQALMKKNAK